MKQIEGQVQNTRWRRRVKQLARLRRRKFDFGSDLLCPVSLSISHVGHQLLCRTSTISAREAYASLKSTREVREGLDFLSVV